MRISADIIDEVLSHCSQDTLTRSALVDSTMSSLTLFHLYHRIKFHITPSIDISHLSRISPRSLERTRHLHLWGSSVPMGASHNVSKLFQILVSIGKLLSFSFRIYRVEDESLLPELYAVLAIPSLLRFRTVLFPPIVFEGTPPVEHPTQSRLRCQASDYTSRILSCSTLRDISIPALYPQGSIPEENNSPQPPALDTLRCELSEIWSLVHPRSRPIPHTGHISNLVTDSLKRFHLLVRIPLGFGDFLDTLPYVSEIILQLPESLSHLALTLIYEGDICNFNDETSDFLDLGRFRSLESLSFEICSSPEDFIKGLWTIAQISGKIVAGPSPIQHLSILFKHTHCSSPHCTSITYAAELQTIHTAPLDFIRLHTIPSIQCYYIAPIGTEIEQDNVTSEMIFSELSVLPRDFAYWPPVDGEMTDD